MCDIISATISGGTISAKARAPELHDAASGWHLAAFRRESRVVGGATFATIQRSPPMVFVSYWIENDCSDGELWDLASISILRVKSHIVKTSNILNRHVDSAP